MNFKGSNKCKVYCFDVDNTLTNGELPWKSEPTPNNDCISELRELYSNGNIIIIHTARLWEDANETVGWLIKHKIPFHGIMMQKGGADYYIDDKMLMPKGK